MFQTKLRRIFKAGFVNFWRNGVVSLASVLVVSATLFVVASLVLGSAVLDATLTQVRDKVDINVYMRSDATESDILSLKGTLEKLPEVAVVQYVSKDQALANFKKEHQNDTAILQSLDEIGGNPLRAILNIKAKNPSQYEAVSKFLEGGTGILSPSGVSIVDKVNFQDNKLVIDRLTQIISSAHTLGYAVTVIFVLMAILVTFTTIRLAIYTAREEISVMRLVGASNNYVRGPFIVEGVLYGFFSSLLVMVFLYPLSLWIGQTTQNFFGGLNVLAYYSANFFELFLVLFAVGTFLGAISSWLAVRRYLNV